MHTTKVGCALSYSPPCSIYPHERLGATTVRKIAMSSKPVGQQSCLACFYFRHSGRRDIETLRLSPFAKVSNTTHVLARCRPRPCPNTRNTDVDIDELPGSFLLVTLGCDHGTLTLSPAAGLRFVSGDTDMWAGEVSFDGVASFFAGLSTANEALGGITYRPNRDWNGNDTLTVSADDRGWSTEVISTADASLAKILA